MMVSYNIFQTSKCFMLLILCPYNTEDMIQRAVSQDTGAELTRSFQEKPYCDTTERFFQWLPRFGPSLWSCGASHPPL